MKTKMIALGIIFLLVGVVGAAAIQNYYFPQTATIPEIELTIYLETEPWENETGIEWGDVFPNTIYSYNLTVQNEVNSTVQVYMEVVGLDVDWILEWTANGSIIDYEESIEGLLELTVPLEAAPGAYGWVVYIKGEYT